MTTPTMMPGMSICGLPDGAAWPIRTIVEKFRDEFEAHVARQDPDHAAKVLAQTNPAICADAMER